VRRAGFVFIAIVILVAAPAATIGIAASLLSAGQSHPARGSLADLMSIVQTDRVNYAPGETVQVTWNVTNTGVAPVYIEEGGCGVAWSFFDSDRKEWYNSLYGQACSLAIITVPLAPGKCMVSSFAWNQSDFNGTLVPLGRYYRVAAFDGIVVDAPGKEVLLHSEAWFFIRLQV
jgi:hypothetical protein